MSNWWQNWGSTSSSAQQAGAAHFLATGNVPTVLGGTTCKGSNECASGYACSGGKCVPINGAKNANDGTLGGCGDGSGGGNCDSLTGTNVGVTSGGSTVYGDVVVTQGGVSTGYQWEPVYAADGCTIAGCKLGKCGTEDGSVCPGGKYCKYDQNGNVSCGCGDPPDGNACSVFCDGYSDSFGTTGPGCDNTDCGECYYCDSFTKTCVESGSAPCHCKPESLPPCTKCNEDGTTSPDNSNCSECFTISKDCPCGITIEKTCCYEMGADGLSGYNKCYDEINCYEEGKCKPPGEPGFVDPCEGTCETKTYCGTTCPSPPDNPPGGVNTVVGQIEVPGQCCILVKECDTSDVPPECEECDCNCHNDCPNCQLCGADGKCYPDPDCEGNWQSEWSIYIPNYSVCTMNFEGCGISNCNVAGGFTSVVGTSSCGPLPHSLVETTSCSYNVGSTTTGGCLIKSTATQHGAYQTFAQYDIIDGNGNIIGSLQGNGPIGWGGGAHPATTSPGCQAPFLSGMQKCGNN